MSKFTVLPRAAAVVAALALALPALAQTNQPATPAGNAPAVSTDKSVNKQTTGEVKSDKSKTHAAKDMKDGDKSADHKQSAQAPAKKTDAPAKSDNKAQ
jgi:hypothetical protein